MNDFAIIPAIDLKDGAVVHASGGMRAAYRPIETPLGVRRRSDRHRPRASRRQRSAGALHRRPRRHRGHRQSFRAVPRSFERPSGTRRCGSMPASPTSPIAPSGCRSARHLVIGSESLSCIENWHELRATFGESLVLSLDFARRGMRGPAALFAGAGALARPSHRHEPRSRRHRRRSRPRAAARRCGTAPDRDGLCLRRHARHRRP